MFRLKLEFRFKDELKKINIAICGFYFIFKVRVKMSFVVQLKDIVFHLLLKLLHNVSKLKDIYHTEKKSFRLTCSH